MKLLKIAGLIGLGLWMTLRTLHAFGAETVLDEAVTQGRGAISAAEQDGTLKRAEAIRLQESWLGSVAAAQKAYDQRDEATRALTAATDARIKAEQKLVCVREVPINEAACKSAFGESGMDQARAMWTDYHQAATTYSDRNWFGRTFGKRDQSLKDQEKRKKEIEGALTRGIETAKSAEERATREVTEAVDARGKAETAYQGAAEVWGEVAGNFEDQAADPLSLKKDKQRELIAEGMRALAAKQSELGLDSKVLTLDLAQLKTENRLNDMEFEEMMKVMSGALDKAALGQYVMEKINAANKSDAFCQNVAACSAEPATRSFGDIFKSGMGGEGSPMRDGKPEPAQARPAR